MIRINIYDNRNKLVGFLDSAKPQLVVGRSLEADVIIPDFKIDQGEVRITQTPELKILVEHGNLRFEFTGTKSFKLKSYLVVITDLNFFAQKETVNTPEVDNSLLHLKVLTGLTVLMIFYFDLIAEFDSSLLDTARDLILSFLSVAIFSFILSVLSRIVNGEYHFIKITNSVMQIMLILAVFAFQGFGIRWILPSVFRYDLVWGLLAMACISQNYKSLILLAFDSISPKIKRILIAAPGVLILLTLLLIYFPFQAKYKHLSISLRPPLFRIFESGAKDHAQAMSEFEQFIK